MDFRGFSLKIKDVLKEARVLMDSKNVRVHRYDLVIVFARIWFLKSEIFVHMSSIPLTSVEDFIKSLHEGSTFLQNSFSPELEETTESQILNMVELIPGQVESLYQTSQHEDSGGNRIRDLLYKFLVQVMLSKAEVLLLELLKSEISLMVPLNNLIGTLREGLIFLIESDIHQPKEEDTDDEKQMLKEFEKLAARVVSLCNSCLPGRITKKSVQNMKWQLAILLVMVLLLKSKLKKLYLHKLHPLPSPNIPGLESIESALDLIKQLPSGQNYCVACATYQIKSMEKDLEFIMHWYGPVLEEQIEKQNRIDRIDDILTQLAVAARQVEHVIESMMLGRDPVWRQLLWLYHLSEVIVHLKTQLNDYEMKDAEDEPEEDPDRFWQRFSTPTEPLLSVGLHDEKAAIIKKLTGGSRRLDGICITGMAGIGKTHLALSVFHSPVILRYFHIRAFCTVSQVLNRRNLLLDILNQITNFREYFFTMSEDDLRQVLWRTLRGRRYLIVLDDIWNNVAWDYLKISLPDDCNGSRILITSPINNVTDWHWLSLSLSLSPLSDESSLELMNMKVREFGDKFCSPKLFQVTRQLAKTCKGLPFAIIYVANLLLTRHEDQWPEVAEIMFQELARTVFQRSYHNLPNNLKQCFLYLGAFPKDEDISVRRLLWLWIAEGFIRKMSFKSLQDVAERRLMDLLDRYLVTATKIGSRGKVRTCRVNSLVHDFCLSKAKEAKFLTLISGEIHSGSSSESHHEHFHSEHHRLSVCGDPRQFIASRPSGPFVRALMFLGRNEMYPGCQSDVSFIFDNFQYLKVLDLESINVGNTLENRIDLAIHLRYLGVGGDMDFLPSSLSKLQNLETLVVKGLGNKFVLPDTIWGMTKLRHVHVTNHCIFTLPNDKNGSYSRLESLLSLSMPSFSYGEETNKIIERVPNLQKLKCIFLEPPFGSQHVYLFPKFESLSRLESLKLLHSGWRLNNVGWSFPKNLRKLTLSNFRLPWDQLSPIGELPNLEVLKLISGAFEGSNWKIRDSQFLKLQYLKLDSLNFIHWYADDGHLPCLEHLVLRNCKQLERVPLSFDCIPTLQRIEIHQCRRSVRRSVREIIKNRLEMFDGELISVFS